jgi:DeoR/GlpR family transcriptional regulator of sugar metabolism
LTKNKGGRPVSARVWALTLWIIEHPKDRKVAALALQFNVDRDTVHRTLKKLHIQQSKKPPHYVG